MAGGGEVIAAAGFLVRRADANWEGQGGRTALRSKFNLGQPFGGPDN